MNKNKIIIVFSWILGAMLFGCSDSDANENNNSGDKGFTYSDVITAYDRLMSTYSKIPAKFIVEMQEVEHRRLP